MKKILAKGVFVNAFQLNQRDYISLTDIAKYKDVKRSDYIIQNWMRTRDTIEFLGLWEKLNNDGFKPIEFDGFKNNAGLNSFSLTPKRWIKAVNATGVISKSGRYGGGTFVTLPKIFKGKYKLHTPIAVLKKIIKYLVRDILSRTEITPFSVIYDL